MSNYIGYFFSSESQLLALVSVSIVWLSFSFIGAAFQPRHGIHEINHLVGWTLVSILFTFAGVLLKLPFTFLTIAAGLVALLSLVLIQCRNVSLFPTGVGHVLVLGLPLFILVSGMQGSQWDEFTDWLLIPRYLLETDAFPSRESPFSKASLTGYPYNWHFITYLASRVAGKLVESAGALSNIILLFGFALLVARILFIGLEKYPGKMLLSWRLSAFVMLLVTLLNPTFAQKVVLTSYADTSSAVTTATASVITWFLLEALYRREFDQAKTFAISLGLLLALLINLKQATLVLVVLIVVAAIILALRDPDIPLKRFMLLLPAIIGPAAVMFLVWRYHLTTELSLREMSVKPFDSWLIDLIPQILTKMLIVLSKKGVYLILIVIVIIFGLRGLWRSQTSFDRFAALVAMVVLGYNAFLLCAYVTTFSQYDALRAASYWRYNMHLGALVVIFTAYGSARLLSHRLTQPFHIRRMTWMPVILIIVAPFIFAHKLRFDQKPMIKHYRTVSSTVAELIKSKSRILNVDPQGSGESSAVLTFELGERAYHVGEISAYTDKPLKTLQSAITKWSPSSVSVHPGWNTGAILVHSTINGFGEALGLNLTVNFSYFLKRTASGGWKIVKSWQKPNYP